MTVSNNIFENKNIQNSYLTNLYKFHNYKEFTLGSWNFLSPENIQQYENMYYYKMIDIATKYIGMGHYWVLSYIPSTKKYFVRQDGCSNDYDRQFNYENYADDTYQPGNFEIYKKNCTDKILNFFCIYINKPDNFEENKQYDFNSILDLVYTH